MQVVIRDNQKIGLGHFYGEVLVPISSCKKNQVRNVSLRN
jgi:hypothetical protein